MPDLEIYLDANATTPVLPQARAAALEMMAAVYGNPSSTHASGLRARARMAAVRACARRVLGAPSGEQVFVSRATEGIQTAVLSALLSLRGRSDVDCVLYGATEHSAVPEALRHWSRVLGLGLDVWEIPVFMDGTHDIDWLRRHARRAGLVCTMAANNETGVVSPLAGIAGALLGSPALWLVDGVQALGKLPLDLSGLPIDYAVFSGHKLYAPKGIGLLYVREGAPFTPMMAGGGQEAALRSGTENLPGIAALGAVLEALEAGDGFRDAPTLRAFNDRLASSLREDFPGLVFNAEPASCLPTTLSFSVPGMSSRAIIDVFDAAGLRVSGGSACSAASATPSHVLTAMGLPRWQAESAVRLSFGPASTAEFIEEACVRIRQCGAALQRHGWLPTEAAAVGCEDGITCFTDQGVCCYTLVSADARCSVVIDPHPAVQARLLQWLRARGLRVAAVLSTRGGGEGAWFATVFQEAAADRSTAAGAVDAFGWPLDQESLTVGRQHLRRRLLPPSHAGMMVCLWGEAEGPSSFAFVGDLFDPVTQGPTEGDAASDAQAASAWRCLGAALAPHTVLLPRLDPEGGMAGTVRSLVGAQPGLAGMLDTHQPPASPEAASPRHHECDAASLRALLQRHPGLVVVDVREPVEQELGPLPHVGRRVRKQSAPLSTFSNALPGWLGSLEPAVLLFVCRSGNRSSKAARALARMGHPACYSLTGGLSLISLDSPWPDVAPSAPAPALRASSIPN